MRRVARQSEPSNGTSSASSSGWVVAVAAAILGVALLGSSAQALNAQDSQEAQDAQEMQAEQTLPSYAGTRVADDYDPKQAAHPLRIVAYGLHPVGVALDWIVVRPAFWVVRHEPFRTIFGYQD
jgi:hypothetical protein